jgi:hypothetical protein
VLAPEYVAMWGRRTENILSLLQRRGIPLVVDAGHAGRL